MSPRPARQMLALPALALTLGLTACGGDSGNKAAASSPTAVQTSSASSSSSSQPSSSSAPRVTRTVTRPVVTRTAAAPRPATPRRTVAAAPRAAAEKVAAPGTVCYTQYDSGSGHERYRVVAEQNVTCGFAKNVGITAHDHGGTDDHFDVQAASPATGKTYTMHCVFGGGASIECEGATNAKVEVGLNTGY